MRVVSFQAIQDTTIELGALTVLTGDGDVGKSSFIRAMRSAFLNSGNDLDIRHDTKQCEVVLTFDDGTVIKWSKALGKGGQYQMTSPDGKATSYTKCGGEVPDAVAQFLGIGVIEVDDTTDLTPQVSDQHDQPFVLWLSGSRQSRAIGKATRLDVVVTAQMACKKRLDANRRGLGETVEEAKDVNAKIEALPPFERIGERAKLSADTLQMVRVNLALANNLSSLHDRFQIANQKQEALDLTSVKEILEGASAELSRVELFSNLDGWSRRLKESDTELEVELLDAKSKQEIDIDLYQSLCSKEGICPDCEGLFDHNRCKA